MTFKELNMTFDEAKKIFADNFREVGGCNWENDNVFVIGTNSRNVEVKVQDDGLNFCVVLCPYCIKSWAGSLTSIKLATAKVEQIADLGRRAAKACFDALAKEEDDK